jgi:hypothetical protein
MVTLAAAPGAV